MQVILLNSDYTFLNVINWKKAVCLIFKGKVEVLKETTKVLENFEKTIEMTIPKVLRLVEFVSLVFKNKINYNKRNVLQRDNFKCMYCGTKKEQLTIDHVIPKSRGGRSTFLNCVASCKPCNSNKGNLTLEESGMKLRMKPYIPTVSEFLMNKVKQLGLGNYLNF